jgi:dethiobiotin synthetase
MSQMNRPTANHPITIVGTDTNCGKTVITGLIAQYLSTQHGYRVTTQKFVQTGTQSDCDLTQHQQIAPQIINFDLALRCPYRFCEPVSPHFAAATAGEPILPERIYSAINQLTPHVDYLVCETSGGILVPYSDTMTQLDLLKALNHPLIVVSPNRLGTLNHTMLTIERLHTESLPVLGIILTHCDPSTPDTLRVNNRKTLDHWSPAPILGEVPYLKTASEIITRGPDLFYPVGKAILQAYTQRRI